MSQKLEEYSREQEKKLEENSQEQEQKLSQKLEEYSREQEKKIQEHEVQIKRHKIDIEKNTKKAQKQPEELNAKVEEGYEKSVRQAKELIESRLPVRLPPVELVCNNVTKEWYSEPFYSNKGGYKLKLHHQPPYLIYSQNYFSYKVIESEFPVELPFKLEITVHIIHPNNGEPYVMKNTHKTYNNTEQVPIHSVSRAIFQVYTNANNQMKFRVVEAKVL